MYTQYPFSEQKQWKVKVKVKETDPTRSQIWLFPVSYKYLYLPPGQYKGLGILITLSHFNFYDFSGMHV